MQSSLNMYILNLLSHSYLLDSYFTDLAPKYAHFQILSNYVEMPYNYLYRNILDCTKTRKKNARYYSRDYFLQNKLKYFLPLNSISI